jgi:hypothetical protein
MPILLASISLFFRGVMAGFCLIKLLELWSTRQWKVFASLACDLAHFLRGVRQDSARYHLGPPACDLTFLVRTYGKIRPIKLLELWSSRRCNGPSNAGWADWPKGRQC